MFATIPIPREWPEQQVKVVDEEITPNVQSVRNRTLDGGVEQILISIPFLPHGQEARALVTYEVVRHSTLAPNWRAPPNAFRWVAEARAVMPPSVK